MRYFLEISFNGTNYHGWQHQDNANSIQDEIEKALKLVLRQPTRITGAGRTDTGVHARQMFAHFDTQEPLDKSLIQYKLNGILPDDIAIHQVVRVKDDAHARFDAISRAYEYVVSMEKSPFLQDQAYTFTKSLDIDYMNKCAERLIGKKDFKSFCKAKTDVKTYICAVKVAKWELRDGILVFTIKADRFLRNMVRAVTGTLMECGLEKMNIEEFEAVIKARNRNEAGYSVPACGLFLTEVAYPPEIFEINE